MDAPAFCWWAYRHHRTLFEALAYAGSKHNEITRMVWAVRLEEEILGRPFTAQQCADSVVCLYSDVADDMPEWADFVTSALAPTAIPAYRWLMKRAVTPIVSRGMVQMVPSTWTGVQ